MTTVLPSGQLPGSTAAAAAADGQAAGAERAPVIVLTYKHSGAEALWSLLTDHPGLACTSGTGVLPLCEQAAATWRNVDRSQTGTRLSPLAASSIRAMTSAVIIAVLARFGRRRWCEFANAAPRSAEIFLQIYPQTRVLCLHRSCDAVIKDAFGASPWGLVGPEYAPYTAAYPASTPAALTAYWAAVTAPLIEFEQAHPDVCMRVRCEDLAGDAWPADLLAFLGIEAPRFGHRWPDDPSHGSAQPSTLNAPFPVDNIPGPLLARADRLTRELEYPPLKPDSGPNYSDIGTPH
jgi:hypothetical protein